MKLYHASTDLNLKLTNYPLFAVDDFDKAKAFVCNYWNENEKMAIYELVLKSCKVKKADETDDLISELISNPDEIYLNELIIQLLEKYGEFDVLQYSDYDPTDD